MVTVVQKTHGKDFGQIGFHEQPRAMYLIFQGHYRNQMLGLLALKYDLIEEPEVKNAVKVKPDKVKKTVEKQFEVVVQRTVTTNTTIHLTAKNKVMRKPRLCRE